MPLDARKVAHIAANRERIRLGRSETVVFVSVSGGVVAYAAVPGVTFYEAGAVPAGVSTRAGDVTRVAHDAIAEFPVATVWPAGLRVVARTGTASQAGVEAAARFVVLDRRELGLGDGNRWVVRLRRLR